MVKHICFLVDWSEFEALRYFTRKLADAFERRGIKTTIVDPNRQSLEPKMFSFFAKDRPDFTCSFSVLDKLPSGKFLWDILNIPHWAILIDPAIYSIELARSPLTFFSVVDRSDDKALKKEGKKVFFFPHGVEKDISYKKTEKRPYDVVFFGKCYDYESLFDYWKKELPTAQQRVLEFAIDIMLTDNKISIGDALMTAWNASRLDFKEGEWLFLFHCLDKFVRGKDRVELIKSIEGANVHVFGYKDYDEKTKTYGWSRYLTDQKNVTLHDPITFDQSLDIMRQSKVCLNSSPFFRDGTHERIFYGLGCGSAVVTSESLYLRETLKDGEDIHYYQSKHWNDVNDKLESLLENEDLRKQMVMSGRDKVLKHHTWDNRVEKLLEELSMILDQK